MTTTSTTFKDFALIEPLHRSLAEEGYTTPTPIQSQSIAPLLAGKDLIGVAQTGTGKTAAFSLPLLQHLWTVKNMPRRNAPRSLILAPTRELAAQIDESIKAYGRHLRITHAVIFGGVGQGAQVQALSRGLDVLVATPGRLLDLMQQGHVRLDAIEWFVLDEADRMLDMGFINDIKKIIAQLPRVRQSAFFSATMPPAVRELAMNLVRNPVEVSVAPEQPTVERIKQSVYFVDKERKDDLLLHLLQDASITRVVIFTRMKHVANKLSQRLSKAGIPSDAIHGNKSQGARIAALHNFKSGKTRVLVATDIAARGLDIDGISHVINYELSDESETYVHRIGRTARAGAEGDAISLVGPSERDQLRDIERLIQKKIPVVTEQPYHSEQAMHASGAAARPEPRKQFSRGPRRSGGPARHTGASSHRGPSRGRARR